MMKYYFCRFRGYLLMVYAENEIRALFRLVEYVRVTKGNLGYPVDEIKRDAKIDNLDFVDDNGYLSRLLNIKSEVEKLKKDFNNRLDEKINELSSINEKLRDLTDALNLSDGYYEDW